MLTGKYVRPAPKELVGERALLRRKGDSLVMAQFNDLEKFSRHEYDWALGWHQFTLDSFEIEENDDGTTNLGK